MRANQYYSTEGYMTNLTTPIIQQTSDTSSLQFYYSQYSPGTSKFLVQINRLSGKPAMKPKQFNLDLNGWVMGCIDLPANEQISVKFIAVSGDRNSYSLLLDDVSYNESSCIGKFNLYSSWHFVTTSCLEPQKPATCNKKDLLNVLLQN